MNVYTPTKWAITALTDTLRRETNQLKNRKVRISSVSPGCVKTEIHLAAGSSGDFFDVVPHLTPQDISNQIMYLLSQPPNVYIQELTVRPVGEEH
uniref:CSON013046 protein n=1 Tax=Culicoides sonorensis TaxID=179676 RepID=A0A336KXM2_CULSO